MRSSVRALAAALCLACLVTTASARADELADLEKARAAYYAKNYDDADARLRTLLDPKSGVIHDPAIVADARMYLGATMLAKGRSADASALFERLMLEKPEYEPDPLSFPSNVVNFFIDVRAKIRDKLSAEKERQVREALEKKAKEQAEKERQAKRLALLEQLASEETVTERNSRWVALLPFGIGQFQNGQRTLGWLFLGSEVALGLAAVLHLPFYWLNVAEGNRATELGNSFEASQYYERARDIKTSQWIVIGTGLAVGIAGILHAQATFVPERTETKKRSIPTVAVTPFVTLVDSGPGAEKRHPGGAMLGASVRF